MTAAPAKSQTIKLATNIPLIGVVQYCDYAKSQKEGYGDQIKLKGTFDGYGASVQITEGSVYLPLVLAYDLVKQGMMEDAGKDRFGNPAWKWLYREKVQILKAEDGQKKFTTVTPYGKNGSPPVQQNEPEPEDPTDEARAIRRRWADMQESYECCVKIALKAWEDRFPEGPQYEPPMDALTAAAHTLFIEANKRNLPPPPKREAE